MSADVIQFAKRGSPPEQGNGAREAMIGAVDEVMLGLASASAVMTTADFILGRLAADGFVIVPLETILNAEP